MNLGRPALSDYGTLQDTFAQMHRALPRDLNFERWQQANPQGAFDQWRHEATSCLRERLSLLPAETPLNCEVIERVETPDFIRERIVFNTTPWFRVPGYFYTPRNVALPAPALVVFHEWGGPMIFGADRICGDPIHDSIVEHRDIYSSGRALSDWYASQGYCVITIDAFHFGSRVPLGLGKVPESYDLSTMDTKAVWELSRQVHDFVYTSLRQLAWAGTTWAGVNLQDDARCIDYLLSRPEVDPTRIGCTGLSGGGWRTNVLAAMDDRIAAAASVGWMTTNETQFAYNLAGAVGSFNVLPGVWNRMDVPDLIAMAAPKPYMVVSCSEDMLFPPAGQRDAARQIAMAYDCAGAADHFIDYAPAKPHCYDSEIQERALSFFDQHFKP